MDDSRIVQLFWDRDEEAITASEAKYGDYCTLITVSMALSRLHPPRKRQGVYVV